MATDGSGTWLAVWFNQVGGGEKDIRVARSTDNGLNWTAAAHLQTNGATDTGNDVNSQIATDGSGTWIVVWMSQEAFPGTLELGTDFDVLVARSTDAGDTWSPPAALNTNADTDSGLDRDP